MYSEIIGFTLELQCNTLVMWWTPATPTRTEEPFVHLLGKFLNHIKTSNEKLSCFLLLSSNE